MKKLIKANLYLPKECYEFISERWTQLQDYLEESFNMSYEFYLGEYDNKEVCGISIQLVNQTSSQVKADYKAFKSYLKELTGKTPKQVTMVECDRI